MKWDNYIPKVERETKTNIYSPHNIHGTKVQHPPTATVTSISSASNNTPLVKEHNIMTKPVNRAQSSIISAKPQSHTSLIQVAPVATNILQPGLMNNTITSVQIPLQPLFNITQPPAPPINSTGIMVWDATRQCYILLRPNNNN